MGQLKGKLNIFAYFLIQTTFGILYFTFDVCTKDDVDASGSGGGGSRHITEEPQAVTASHEQQQFTEKYENKSASDKFKECSDIQQKLYLPFSNSSLLCANLVNATDLDREVFFSKLEDIVWVRTCLISAMGLMSFFASFITCPSMKMSNKVCRSLSSLHLFFFSLFLHDPQHQQGQGKRKSLIKYYHKLLLLIGCAFVLCGTFSSAITVNESVPLFIAT